MATADFMESFAQFLQNDFLAIKWILDGRHGRSKPIQAICAKQGFQVSIKDVCAKSTIDVAVVKEECDVAGPILQNRLDKIARQTFVPKWVEKHEGRNQAHCLKPLCKFADADVTGDNVRVKPKFVDARQIRNRFF